jgi:hypothetical protein
MFKIVVQRVVLWFAILCQILPTLFILMDKYHMDAIKYVTPKINYLGEIEGRPHEVVKIRKFLAEFDSLVPTNIVPTEGYRKISITVIDDFWYNPLLPPGKKIIGSAKVMWISCPITLPREHFTDDQEMKDTVIHEYLHCFGYKHIDILTDLMYKSSWLVDPKSVQRYAEDLEERLK